MVTITMGNVDTWFVGLYKSYIEGIGEDGLGKKIWSGDSSTVIFDERGNLAITPTNLYFCYRLWYDSAKPEDRLVSLKKFGMIMKEVLGPLKSCRKDNQVYKIYSSDIKNIGKNIKDLLDYHPDDIALD